MLLAAWIVGLGDTLEPLISRISDAEYVNDEVPILLAGLVLLALAFRAHSRDVPSTADPVLSAR